MSQSSLCLRGGMEGMTVREIRQQRFYVTFNLSVISLNSGIGMNRTIHVMTKLSWLSQAIIRQLPPMQMLLGSLLRHHISLMLNELMMLLHPQSLK